MKVLVTGATGHIGNVLIRELLVRGQKVRAMVMPGEDLEPLNGLDVEVVAANVLDPAALQKAMRGVRIVYHLAGIISIMPGDYEKMRAVKRCWHAECHRSRPSDACPTAGVHQFDPCAQAHPGRDGH